MPSNAPMLSGSFLSRAKDRLAESAARSWVNQQFSALGTMTSLQIDSTAKTLRLELQLAGESTPIHVTIQRYELLEEAGQTYLRVEGVETSREWLTLLLKNYLAGRRLPVPAALRIAF